MQSVFGKEGGMFAREGGVFGKDSGVLRGHISRMQPQAVRSYVLNKARKIRRSRSASHGRNHQRSDSEGRLPTVDDGLLDASMTQDSERSERRLSSLVRTNPHLLSPGLGALGAPSIVAAAY